MNDLTPSVTPGQCATALAGPTLMFKGKPVWCVEMTQGELAHFRKAMAYVIFNGWNPTQTSVDIWQYACEMAAGGCSAQDWLDIRASFRVEAQLRSQPYCGSSSHELVIPELAGVVGQAPGGVS